MDCQVAPLRCKLNVLLPRHRQQDGAALRLAVVALEIDSVGYDAIMECTRGAAVNDDDGEPLSEWLGRRMRMRTADGIPQRDLDDMALSA